MFSITKLEIDVGDILQTLKVAAVQRPNKLAPAVIRRNKLLVSIHEQIEAAKARAEGKRHSVKQVRKIKNKETGDSIEQVRDRAVRESWWVGNDSRVYMELRYGWKPLEIAKGKTTIEIGEFSNLLPVLEKLRKAASAGEFDNQLNEAFSKLAAQLEARRKKATKH